MNITPIVLFVYNRPLLTKRTLESLRINELADQSVLFVYADGPKAESNTAQLNNVKEVRNLIKSRQWCKEVHLIEDETNKGLAKSVISGVSEVVNKFGKVIVLEDDLILSKGFIRYMNDALLKYERCGNVMQISGYNFPVKRIKKNESSFFVPMVSSWGWATWKRAWDKFDPLAMGYEKLKTDRQLEGKFNLDNSFQYSSMLYQQMESNLISSWAVRWWWTIFKNEGLTLFPDKSLVKNIGFSIDGTHTKSENPYSDDKFDSDYKISSFPEEVVENSFYFNSIKEYIRNANRMSNERQVFNMTTLKSIIRQVSPPIIITIAKKIKNKIFRTNINSNLEIEGYSVGLGTKIEGFIDIRMSGGKIVIGENSYIAGKIVTETENGKINIGNNVFIGGGTLLDCVESITIEDDVLISYQCIIQDSDNHNSKYSLRRMDTSDWLNNQSHNWKIVPAKPIKISKGAWLGAGVFILKGVTIGEGAIVGAASVVTKDVVAWTVVAGNPAKFIREIPEEER